MYDDLMKITDKIVRVVKKPLYGKTFFCPVCHIELSFYDLDENACVICPVCGVALEVHQTYGHTLPVVNDVEINRVQPKSRIHPVATHLPIGLFPLAMMGSLFLLLLSLILPVTASQDIKNWSSENLSSISSVVFIMFAIAVASSLLTYISGVWDWKFRYGQRPYRVITLKIIFSALFLLSGIAVVLLHNVVFADTGVINFTNPITILATLAYFGFQGLAMLFIATLGHVGGYLVFGK
ncbi:MAG: hypothetical protein JXR91_06310 [Deltaproteobacteria bacterium]|nr:hypothetical protein [Deltaproteobacteria bacterium]